MTATLSDVARLAGVSEATASRALNGRRYVAAATRTRVEAAVRMLDYVPHRAARDLSRARTRTVALLVHHAQYPAHGEGTFSARVLEGVSRALDEHRYDLLYIAVGDDAPSRLRSLAAVHAGRADGALMLGPAFPRKGIAALAATGRPVVLIDNRFPGLDAILADNRAGSSALVRHLVVDHGYRRLACLAGPPRWPSTAERISATRRTARSLGASVRVIHAPETTIRDGSDGTTELLPDLPDAIVGVNDAMAIGALHRLRSVPAARRPAVVGHDDIAWARLTDPPLTTVGIDAPSMGATAATLLVERIATADDTTTTPPPPRELRVPVTLRVRQSCGCPANPTIPGD